MGVGPRPARALALTATLACALGASLALPATGGAALPGFPGRIAFDAPAEVGGEEVNEIFTVNPDGTGLNQVTALPEGATQPAFSPDGTEIAFVADKPQGKSAIAVVGATATEAGEGQVSVVREPPAGAVKGTADTGPAFSPDGTKIAYVYTQVGNEPNADRNIWIGAADGSGTPTNLTAGAREGEESFDPAFSPDGSKIAFIRAGHLWVMDADGSGAAALKDLPAANETIDEPAKSERALSWSPDGSRIALALDEGTSPPTTERDIWAADPTEAAAPSMITDHDRVAGAVVEQVQPAYSPEGSEIVATCTRQPGGTQSELCITNVASEASKPIDALPENAENPDWQPTYQSQPPLPSPGPVWTWGTDVWGGLGDGGGPGCPEVNHPALRATPIPAVGESVAVGGGETETLAVRPDGTVWGWGCLAPPSQIPGITNATAVTGGQDFSLALRSDGTVWAWGSNYQGELGNGTIGGTDATPAPVPGIDGAVAIAAAGGQAVALLANGTVLDWGENSYGGASLGNPAVPGNSGSPVRVVGLSDVTAIATIGTTTFALRSDGTVWGWGGDVGAVLPYGGNTVTPVRNPDLADVVAIAAGANERGANGLALESDGTVQAWGSNDLHQLGNGPADEYLYVPQVVPHLSNVIAIASAAATNYAVTADGTLWAWGGNECGELGVGASGLGYHHSANGIVTCTGPGAETDSPTPVASLTGLRRGAFALGMSGSTYAPSIVGGAAPPPPIVTTGPASDITQTGAVISVTVNPVRDVLEQTSATHVYLASNCFSQQEVEHNAAGEVTFTISGLKPGQTCSYEASAGSSQPVDAFLGYAYGTTRTFTTLPAEESSGTAGTGKAKVSGDRLLIPVRCVGPAGSKCLIAAVLTTEVALKAPPGHKPRKRAPDARVLTRPFASKTHKKGHGHKRHAHKRKRVRTVGRAKIALAAGQSKTLVVKLNATGRELLRHHRRLPTKLTVTQTHQAGSATSTKPRVLLTSKAIFTQKHKSKAKHGKRHK